MDKPQNKDRSDGLYENTQTVDGWIDGGFIKSGSISTEGSVAEYRTIDKEEGGKRISIVSNGEKGTKITQTKDSVKFVFDEGIGVGEANEGGHYGQTTE